MPGLGPLGNGHVAQTRCAEDTTLFRPIRSWLYPWVEEELAFIARKVAFYYID